MAKPASHTTKGLADKGGGSIKNGGKGMEGGITRIRLESLGEGAAMTALVAGTVAVACKVIPKIQEHSEEKTNELLATYYDLIYKDNITYISELAKVTERDPKIVRKEIQKLIKKGLLDNAKFDVGSDILLITETLVDSPIYVDFEELDDQS